jgi:anthranilate synthase
MAIEHTDLPIAAVQFHPESVMTLHDEVGIPIIASMFSILAAPQAVRSALAAVS